MDLPLFLGMREGGVEAAVELRRGFDDLEGGDVAANAGVRTGAELGG